jgi:molybdopterin-guanine dinucleotide biosynthesis protein A
MDAIVLAGGVPDPESSLYPHTQGDPKALLDIGGKPMIQWVLDALDRADTIEGVVVVGCEGRSAEIQSKKVIEFLPSTDDIIRNFQLGADAVLKHNPGGKSVAVVSGDIPLITAEGVNWVINTSLSTDDDIYYCVVEQRRMEARFPDSARSYVKLQDMNVCGGDLAVIDLDLYKSRKEFWRKIFEARKNYFNQAALIGFDILFLLLFRRIKFNDLVQKVTRRLDITGRGLICPFPEIAMDIDKPHQLEIALRELS